MTGAEICLRMMRGQRCAEENHHDSQERRAGKSSQDEGEKGGCDFGGEGGQAGLRGLGLSRLWTRYCGLRGREAECGIGCLDEGEGEEVGEEG